MLIVTENLHNKKKEMTMSKQKSKKKEFTASVSKFIASYAGKGTCEKAAEVAGISYDYARRLLLRPDVCSAIMNRDGHSMAESEAVREKLIADRVEIQIMLTKIVRDSGQSEIIKMKAVDILNKMNCSYSEKRIIEGGDRPVEMNSLIRHIDIEERKRMLDIPENESAQPPE